MCTVAFIPNNGNYLIASLRDEHPSRTSASLPILKRIDQQKFIAPIDSVGGGTWVGINEMGAVIVLLNGGFVNHEKKNSYAKSRGKIVTELLSQELILDSWQTIDLKEIEPFTLIYWSGKKLYNLVWDGHLKHQLSIDSTRAQIWSSATLYNDRDKNLRRHLFENWIKKIEKNKPINLLEFFKEASVQGQPIFIKNEDQIKTHSYTCIEINREGESCIHYHDLSAGSVNSILLSDSFK